MTANKTFYVPQLEWEAIDFPILLTNLKFEDTKFEIDDAATLKIWRDDSLQLNAVITGRLKDLNYSDKYVGKGNIAQHLTITGLDEKVTS